MAELLILFALGSLTALACGLGAIPVLALGERVEPLRPALWGLAAGLMALASVVGLLVPAFEEEFGIEIPDDAAETIQTFGDAVKFIQAAA